MKCMDGDLILEGCEVVWKERESAEAGKDPTEVKR
jgi:hypothetical protein